MYIRSLYIRHKQVSTEWNLRYADWNLQKNPGIDWVDSDMLVQLFLTKDRGCELVCMILVHQDLYCLWEEDTFGENSTCKDVLIISVKTCAISSHISSSCNSLMSNRSCIQWVLLRIFNKTKLLYFIIHFSFIDRGVERIESNYWKIRFKVTIWWWH